MTRSLATLALTVFVGICATPSGFAAQPGQPVRVGWLSAGNMESHQPAVDAFREGMKELGYTEGKNYVIDFHWGSDTVKSYGWMARDMVRNRPDVIVATCEYTSTASLKATTDVPVVLAISGDPVKLGYVKSISRPGTNVTGLASISPALAAKRLELLKEVVPKATRIAVLHQPDDDTSVHGLAEARAAAKTLGLELTVFEATSAADYERVFAQIRPAKPDALLVLPGTQLAFINRRTLAKLALDARLPASFPYDDFVTEGGLMSYGADVNDQFRRSASYVDRLVKGAKAGDLPMEQPTRFEMAINAKTAKALGITVPSSVLVRADRVVQ